MVLVETECTGGLPGIRRFGAGGAPRLERWKAFIFACISSGRPPVRMFENDDGGIPGRRAAFKVPSGVEEAVMLAVAGESEVGRRDGIRGLGAVADGRAKSAACVSAGRLVDTDSEEVLLVTSGDFRVRASSSVVASAIAAVPKRVGLFSVKIGGPPAEASIRCTRDLSSVTAPRQGCFT